MTQVAMVLLVLATAAFLLKLLWNVGVPFAAARIRDASPRRGISLHPSVDVILLVLGCSFAYVARGWSLAWRAGVLGVISIAASYALMLLVGLCVGLLISRSERRSEGPASAEDAREDGR